MSKLFKISNDLIANQAKKFISLVGIFSIMVLCLAYLHDNMSAVKPCFLCLMQRVPYFLLVIISMLALWFKKNYQEALKLIAIIYLLGASLAVYHVGVENGFFQMTTNCALEDELDFVSPEQFKAMILNKKVASCNTPTLVFSNFNLSFAELNVILSVFMFILTLFIIGRVNAVTR